MKKNFKKPPLNGKEKNGHEIELETVKIKNSVGIIKENPDRFRKSIGDIEDLKASIKEVGQIDAILTDKEGMVISGHLRLRACMELGITPKIREVNYSKNKDVEVHANAFTRPYEPREAYEVWCYINGTESKKPGPKGNDNSIMNEIGLRPIDKAAIATSMGVAKISQIKTIYESGFEDIIEKLDNGQISVNYAYNLVKKMEKLAEDLENESSEKMRFKLEPYKYEEGFFYQPYAYGSHHHHSHIIGDEKDLRPTLTTSTGLFHPDKKEFTLREYASWQNFPEDFKFVGTVSTIRKQIGNAVSPKMGAYATKDLKGKTCGDLFAGCGGFSLGAKRNDIETKWAIEWDVSAAKTFQLNFPEVKVHQENIKFFLTLPLEKVDIIIGGPPCQGFSKAGHQFKDDPRNEGYKWFLDVINTLRPAEFIMENVPDILKNKDEIESEFDAIGYDVEIVTIKGKEIGMRQHRIRVFFKGTLRTDVDANEMAIAA